MSPPLNLSESVGFSLDVLLCGIQSFSQQIPSPSKPSTSLPIRRLAPLNLSPSSCLWSIDSDIYHPLRKWMGLDPFLLITATSLESPEVSLEVSPEVSLEASLKVPYPFASPLKLIPFHHVLANGKGPSKSTSSLHVRMTFQLQAGIDPSTDEFCTLMTLLDFSISL